MDEEAAELDLPQYIQNINKFTVTAVKDMLGVIYGDRHYARFAALETIARVPYFSYTSVLHLYETLGWFRKKEYIQIHFAESWNELHHLLIMESLGGNDKFVDRFFAQHIAFFYYWIVVAMYIANPAIAYDLNKHVETHAFHTYDSYLKSHGEELKLQPAPQVAIDYYQKGDLYMFDAFQYKLLSNVQDQSGRATDASLSTGTDASQLERRRPVVETLYDVFYNIREDEAEHADTMRLLQREMTQKQQSD